MNAPAHNLIDPADLSRITDLELIADTIVNGLSSGLHRSARIGSSIEFKQYRPYSQGDDTRFIDWPLYARTDRLHIRQFQEETNLHCTVLLDCSGSMSYSSHEITKFRYAQMLAASLAVLLQKQRDLAGFAGYHTELIDHIPPRAHNNQMRRILTAIENIEPSGETDTASALHYVGEIIRPGGMVVLVSDLLHDLEGMIAHLRSLRARRHDVLVLQISDPAEQTFAFDKPVTLVDAESGTEQFTAPDEVREEYLANRKAHFDAIRAACLASEIDIEEFTTDEPLDRALHHFIRRRHRRLFTSSMRASGSRGGS